MAKNRVVYKTRRANNGARFTEEKMADGLVTYLSDLIKKANLLEKQFMERIKLRLLKSYQT